MRTLFSVWHLTFIGPWANAPTFSVIYYRVSKQFLWTFLGDVTGPLLCGRNGDFSIWVLWHTRRWSGRFLHFAHLTLHTMDMCKSKVINQQNQCSDLLVAASAKLSKIKNRMNLDLCSSGIYNPRHCERYFERKIKTAKAVNPSLWSISFLSV